MWGLFDDVCEFIGGIVGLFLSGLGGLLMAVLVVWAFLAILEWLAKVAG